MGGDEDRNIRTTKGQRARPRTLGGPTGGPTDTGYIDTRFNTPPWTRPHIHIHDLVTHREEHGSRQRLGEEVGEVVHRVHKGTPDTVILHELANEEMTTLDVLHPPVVLGVVGHIDSRTIVNEEVRRGVGAEAKLAGEVGHVHRFLGSFGSRDDLGLAGRERNGLLLVRSPRHGRAVQDEDEATG